MPQQPHSSSLFSSTVFGVFARTQSRQQALARFQHTAGTMHAITQSLPADAMRIPVTIPKYGGISEDMRGWSLGMTLRHCCMVNAAIIFLIERLVENRLPGTMPDIGEDFTPHKEAGIEQSSRLRLQVAHYTQLLDGLPSLHTPARAMHPYFGLLNAHGWHCLLGVHLFLHVPQMRRIRTGLQPCQISENQGTAIS